MMEGCVISNISIQLIVGQNIQQNHLSVLQHVTIVKKDLWTHYSVELPVQINVAIGPVCRPLYLEGRRGTGFFGLGVLGDLVSRLKVIYVLI